MSGRPGAESGYADIGGAIRRGLVFLKTEQEADGSFISYSSARMRPFRRIRSWRTVFVPALMLASLSALDEPEAMAIRRKLAGFLIRQKDDNWSFNYWARKAPERRSQPYPNDLDDTFCALSGLYLHDPAIIDEEALSAAVKLLLATEAEVGGPYRTWLVPPGSDPVWLDVDMAVNSNIAYFLSLVSDGVPNLDRLMGEAIEKGRFSSPYYPSEYAFIYYFSRAYAGSHRDRLLGLARNLHAKAETDLDKALCLSARLRLGDTDDLSKAAAGLVKAQGRGDGWAAAAFYADPVKDGKPYYNGGGALTTAFVLEALGLYRNAVRPVREQAFRETSSKASDPDRTVGDSQAGAERRIFRLAGQESRSLDPTLRGPLLRLLKKLAASDNGREILTLPHMFNRSLVSPLRGEEDFLDRLGLANLYGWLAYTIYDDFLDGEGQPALLPVANTAARRSFDLFSRASPKTAGFDKQVRQTFDTIDAANAWEQAHCRVVGRAGLTGRAGTGPLPDYGDMSRLAERSLGHALPVMAVLAANASTGADDVPADKIIEGFRHYLVARQLNDDVHDWPEDLEQGRMTPAVTAILSDLGLDSMPLDYDSARLMPKARRQFWHGTLPSLCAIMEQHLEAARQSYGASGLLRADGYLSRLLDGLESAVSEARRKQAGAEKFLKAYRGPARAATQEKA